MGKYAQLVIGPAGCGKSTYVEAMYDHMRASGRGSGVHCVNLDPAAERFGYPVSVDVRELVTLEDAMEEVGLGPNGGLLYCMEYLEESLDEWLGEELEGFGDEDYLLIDCPGQIELYNHCSALRTLADYLRNQGWSVAAVYCLDATFFAGGDAAKFIAGALQALAAMVRLELPHVNVLTKMDLVAPEDRRAVDELLIPDGKVLAEQLSSAATGAKFRRLNAAVASLLDEFSLLSFLPLDATDEESLAVVLGNLDMALQYGEDADVKVRDDDEIFGSGRDGGDGDGDGGGGGGGGGGFGEGADDLARAMQEAILGGGGGGGAGGSGNGLGGGGGSGD